MIYLMISSGINLKVLYIICNHFTKVFNWECHIDWEHINTIELKRCITKLDDELLFKEFNNVLDKLVWHKSLGFNRISPNILKLLDEEHYRVLYRFIKE